MQNEAHDFGGIARKTSYQLLVALRHTNKASDRPKLGALVFGSVEERAISWMLSSVVYTCINNASIYSYVSFQSNYWAESDNWGTKHESSEEGMAGCTYHSAAGPRVYLA